MSFIKVDPIEYLLDELFMRRKQEVLDRVNAVIEAGKDQSRNRIIATLIAENIENTLKDIQGKDPTFFVGSLVQMSIINTAIGYAFAKIEKPFVFKEPIVGRLSSEQPNINEGEND